MSQTSYSHVIEKSRTNTPGAGNGETLKTRNDKGNKVGVVYYDPNGGSRTGVIIQAGEVDGEMLLVVNIADAAENITMATGATSHVANGTSCVIGQNEAILFVWSKAIARWYPIQKLNALADNSVTTAKIADANVTPAKTNIVEARTATNDGLTTGIISDTTTHVTVTSASGNNIITLPTPTPGRTLIIDVGANGFKLQSSAPASVAINGGTGASAKSTIAANSTLRMVCVSATAWKGDFLDADSDVAKVPAAA